MRRLFVGLSRRMSSDAPVTPAAAAAAAPAQGRPPGPAGFRARGTFTPRDGAFNPTGNTDSRFTPREVPWHVLRNEQLRLDDATALERQLLALVAAQEGPEQLKAIKQTLQVAAIVRGEDPPFSVAENFMYQKPDLDSVDIRIINTKRTVNMKTGGRRPTMNALVVVGNGHGAVGFGVGKAQMMQEAVSRAILRATRHMIHVPRRDKRTLHHDLHVKYCRTTVHMRSSPIGHGIMAHRTIIGICELAGIADISADVRGSNNPLNIVRATFKALQSQSTIEDHAARRGKSVLLYADLASAPVVIARNPPHPNNLPFADMHELPNVTRRVTRAWLRTFPLPPSPENFALARAVHHKQALSPAVASESTTQQLQQWLAALPATADPSFTPLFAARACQRS